MNKIKRYMILVLALFLLISVPSSAKTAETIGKDYPSFTRAVRNKRIILKYVRVGKTTLIYDSKVSMKRVKAVKRWIKFLPSKVQRASSKVYFLRHSSFMKTGRKKDLENVLGYEIFEDKEIYLYSMSDYEEMQSTLYHEFGHAYDNRTGKYLKYSSSAEWHKIGKGYGNRAEYFADSFSEYYCYLYTKEARFITKVLKYK